MASRELASRSREDSTYEERDSEHHQDDDDDDDEDDDEYSRDRRSLSFLLEYLDTDPLPTFVLDLSASHSREVKILVYSNPALKRHTTVHKQILQILDTSTNDIQRRSSFSNFQASLADFRDGGRQGVLRTSIPFGEINCDVALLRNRWAILTIVSPMPFQEHSVTSQDVILSYSKISQGLKSPPESNAILATGRSRDERLPEKPRLGDVLPYGHLGDSSYLKRFHSYDWSTSPIGPIKDWPSELRMASEMMLAMPYPVAILWGDECTLLYNEPYTEIPHGKYPVIMGRPITESWSPMFETLEKVRRRVTTMGESIKQESQVRYLDRGNWQEEAYFNLVFSPILGEDRTVAGIYSSITENTKQVLAERRIQILIELSKSFASSTTLDELWESLMGELENHTNDVQFAALYSPTKQDEPTFSTSGFNLESTMGVYQEDILFASADFDGVVRAAFDTGTATILSQSNGSLSQEMQLAVCGTDQPCRDVVVQPLASSGGGATAAVLIVGINPLRRFDEEYRAFIQLLAKHTESAITAVKSIEKAKDRLREQAALEGERKFILFAEKAPVGIYMYEKDGTMKYCNKAFEDMCGMTYQELNRPMGWHDVIHPDCLDRLKEIWDIIAEHHDQLSFEVQFKKPWKSAHGNDDAASLDRTWGLFFSHAELTKNGQFNGVLGCVIDMSHAKWAEQTHNERLSEALELKRQQENFLDMTSHEMRNPLNAIFHSACELIDSLSSVLQKDPTPEKERVILKDCLNMAKTIIYCANHQKRIVDDVLTLSKLDSRLLQVCPIDTDPRALLEQVLNIFDSELRASEIEANIECAEGYQRLRVGHVSMDPHRVTQIIINLLTNAIKFMKREARRQLRLELDACLIEPSDNVQYASSGINRQDPTLLPEWGSGEAIYLIFSVQDTGPGMTEQEAVSVFNRFCQGTPRTHAQYGGFGLGLFISRELAEMHGGRIGLRSQPGSGSTFTFYVKVRRLERARDPEAERLRRPLLMTRHRPLSSPRVEDIHTTHMHESRDRRPSTPNSISSSTSPAVLVVEDNIINQRLLKRLLTKHGYEASVANHGQEALAIIAGSAWSVGHVGPRFDIVLCDIEMPVMDGTTCVRRIRQLQKEGLLSSNIPVVAVTGNARIEQIASAKECGFDAVVSKPYQIQDLISIIESFVVRPAS